MLDLFGRSQIRKKIILLFLYNRDKEYYVNQLARLFNISSGTTQRELKKLLTNDFIVFHKKGNMVLYSLNTENILLNDIENIVRKTIGVDAILAEELNNIQGIRFAFIFGSYVKGEFKSSSDIDLYVIGDVKENVIYDSMSVVEKMIQRDVNYHISSFFEFKEKKRKTYFIKEILSEYILIVGDKNEFAKLVS